MESPLFSVILPVHNGARYLRDAVASVCAQTCADWELIALDDGSTDDSPSILRELVAADARIRAASHANCGVATTRNRGLELSRGRYVTFLDQDDILHPRALARLVAAFESTSADVVSGRATDFLTTDGARRFCSAASTDSAPVVSSSPVHDTLHPKPPYTASVRASVWARGYRHESIAGIRFPDGVFGADDWVFTMRVMAKVARHASLEDVVYLHRSHPHNISSDLPMRYIAAMLRAVVTVAAEWCDAPDGPQVPRAEFARALASHVQLWGLMLPCLKTYTPAENRELASALSNLRSAGLLPFVSPGHAMRYFLVRAGLKSLLPVFWRRRFRNMARARANHAEEVG